MRTRRTLVKNNVWLPKQVKWGALRLDVTTLNRNRTKPRTKAKDRQVYLRTNPSE